MDAVVKVLQIFLAEPQTDFVYGRIHVPQVVEQHAAQVIADQWEAQLYRVHEQRIAADGKAGGQIARPGLEIRKGAVGESAAAEEALRQRDFRQSAVTFDQAEIRGARQHQVLGDLIIRRIARHHAPEAGLRSEDVGGQRQVDAGVRAVVRIDRIVALVLDEAHGDEADIDRLRQQRNQFGADQRRSDNIDLAISEAVLQRIRLGKFLSQLNGAFLAAG